MENDAAANIDRQPLDAHVEAVVRRSGTSFFWAMRVLPLPKRRAMYAVYAFCRIVDDIADDPGEEADKRRRLAAWRDEIDRLFAGAPTEPVAVALQPQVAAFGLRREDFLAVIDGMEMDAADRLRVADMDELTRYCDRVACAVGRLSNRIFGIEADCGDRVAFALGQALQLTNILRDVAEDARRDRLYLPADRLRAHGVAAEDLPAILADPGLAGVCAELADLADRHYGEAKALLATCDRKQMRPAIIMMAMYGRIFRRLQRRGWRNIDQPVRLSSVEKLWVLIRHGLA